MRTKYKNPEKSTGDRLKVIMLQLFDMLDYDNLQPDEKKVLIFSEIDDCEIVTNKRKSKRIKVKSCGDDSKTITKYKGKESNLYNSLQVIREQILDMYNIDKLKKRHIKSLISNLIELHFSESE